MYGFSSVLFVKVLEILCNRSINRGFLKLARGIISKEPARMENTMQATDFRSFPILLDTTGEISTMYGAFALPATIIIDREGNIAREI
ncbi:redoxin domain-containing protein [Solibacillus sp. FSL K6-1781]|uniref:peroxiredoxin family protein n=1 Tax=Solibacillus sp. FSL K6-1781 TaxID=2921474 RepID=UPI00315AAD6C